MNHDRGIIKCKLTHVASTFKVEKVSIVDKKGVMRFC